MSERYVVFIPITKDNEYVLGDFMEQETAQRFASRQKSYMPDANIRIEKRCNELESA